MSEKNQIQFFKTMTSAKRGQGAYLRKNLLDTDEAGVYPSTDFINKGFESAAVAEKGYFTINDFVFIKDSVEGTGVYRNGTGSTLDFLGYLLDDSTPIAVCKTSDSNAVLVLLSDGKIYRVTNLAVTELVGELAGASVSGFMVYNGFYWFISFGTVLYRLDPDLATITTVKTTTSTLQSEVVNMQLFNDYIVFTRELGGFVQFDFWSITEGDIDLYQKRVIEENCNHLGMGALNGTLMFIKSVGNITNRKEKDGNIVVTAFDGEKFVELNSIRAGKESVMISGTQQQSIGNGMMLVAIKENESDLTGSLFKNWLLKIKDKGEIEVMFEPGDIATGFEIEAVNAEYSTISMLLEQDDGNTLFYHTDDESDAYDEYENFTTSEYITNLMNNSMNVHKMLSFGVSFEKVFSAVTANKGETLYIDYRTSERDDWTLMRELTSESISKYTSDKFNKELAAIEYANDSIGLTTQSYVITLMPDGKPLPRFNEIQFRFRTKKGFTLLQAWYEYEYIKRNTR